GAYAIEGLSPGGYIVRCVPPKGYVRTAPAAGKYSVDLSPGESVTLRSFGAAPEAHITGRVFDDADGDGVKDSDEAGVAGWRVFVDANHNGIFDTGETSTATGSSGTYTLAGLLPGTYTVRLAVLSGWRVTAPASGHFDDLLLAAGQTLSGKNFGAHP